MRALATVVLLLAACAPGIQVRGGGGDPKYDFRNLQTYSWMPRESTGDPRIDEPTLEGRVRKGVDEDLAAKGYRLVADGGDFKVGYRAVLGSQRSVQGTEGEFDGIWTSDYEPHQTSGSVAVDTVTLEGTLVLRVFDGKSRKMVWEAAAETEIDPRPGVLSPSREDQVRDAIRKMLEMFPP